MKGFITYATYKVENGTANVYLFGRLENGESFQAVKSYKPYFFIKTYDAEKAREIFVEVNYSAEDSDFVNFKKEPLSKIMLDNPHEIPRVRDAFQSNNIVCYEADIRFVYRFLIDHDIKGGLNIEGTFEKGELVNRIYREPKLSGVEFFPILKIMAIDIETNRDATKIFSISLYSENFRKVLIVSNDKFQTAESFLTEKQMLERFLQIIKEQDPDVITGWNFIDFDLKVIQSRCRAANIAFSLGRMNWPSSLRFNESFVRDSDADIPGRFAADSISLLKMSFIKLQDYKLETAAQALLKESKLVTFHNKPEEIERMYKTNPELLIEYNLKDSELVYRILQEKGITNLLIERSLLTGMIIDRVKASIASLDSLYMRETRKQGIICNTINFDNKYERIKGGFVRDSIPGIYENVNLFDFKSLYPSIIRTFNIDPLSFSPEGTITAPNGAKFLNADGILPMLIQRLWNERDKAKRERNMTKSNAIKIIMNSFFGVLANPMCRFFSLDMANGITSFGQHIIKLTAEKFEERGYKVIYGDTDSIFIETKAASLEEAQAVGDMMKKDINAFYAAYVKKYHNRDSFLDLEYEKTFLRFLMPKIRNVDVGAKKRYAGLVMRDGKEKIEITGLEFVRRDWTEASKRFQLELIDRVFHQQDLTKYIKNFVADLKSGKFDEQLIYRKELRKSIELYTKTTPPHVKAARLMPKLEGSLISYVMTTSGPEPVDYRKGKIDYEHYIEKQIKPIADGILSFYELKFDEVIAGNRQKSLLGF